jgi:hypothetical protein
MNDTHFAIVVGVDRYPRLKRHLKAARKDAESFDAWLAENTGGAVPKANRRLIVAELPEDATPEQARPLLLEVKSALLDLRGEADAIAEADDDRWERTRLYFYVSGHGMALRSEEAALLMANAGVDWWQERVNCSDVLNHLEVDYNAFREVVAFADCCRQYIAAAPTSSLGLDTGGPKRGPIRTNRCYATSFGQAAFEPARDGDEVRGYFTRALLDGLHGEAAPAGEAITSENLGLYVERRVPVLTRGIRGGPQKPEFVGKTNSMVFVPASAGPKQFPLAVRFLNFTGRVELVGGFGEAVPGFAPFDAAPGRVWGPHPLEQGFYRVQPVGAGSAMNGLKNRGVFDFTGEPLEGGTHVEEL